MADDAEPAPSYPPLYIRIAIPLDAQGIPFIEDDDTCADWLIQAALEHLLVRMRTEESGEVELSPNQEEGED